MQWKEDNLIYRLLPYQQRKQIEIKMLQTIEEDDGGGFPGY
jgi:hypothetical protein